VYGTAYYISPDVLNKSYNEKSDIWSLGVIMHVLLSGRPPFEGICDDEIIKKVRVGSYDLNIEELSKVTRDAKDLLKKMLAYDQDDRISAEEALR
jgi:calcium-dependent protein kinase